MSRVVTVGFEGEPKAVGEFLSFEGRVDAGTVTRETAVKRSGNAAWKFNPGAGNTLAYVSHSWGNLGLFGYYVRAYFRFDTIPSATTRLLLMRTSTGVALVNARVTSAGKLQLYNEVGAAQIGSDSAATLTTGIWYRIEMFCRTETGATDSCELRLDGVTVASATGLTLSDLQVYQALIGLVNSPGANRVAYVDDMAVNNDQGTQNNTWPGEGKVVYLSPVSDNARDANWTAGAGATTDLWDAVNALPPAGVAAASATNTSQIKNVASDAVGNYDANVQSYAAAGLIPSDRITLVQAVAPVGTSSTGISGALKIVSNPTQSGEDTASHGGTAIGTYGSNWGTHWGSPQTSPSVALGTQPVIRVGKRTASAVELHYCGMHLAVEYTLAAGWRRAVGPAALPAASAAVFTVPAGMRFVIRHIHAQNRSGSSRTFTLSIGGDAATTRLYDAYPLAAGASLDNRRKYVLAAGEAIQAYASAADDVILTITGELIEA